MTRIVNISKIGIAFAAVAAMAATAALLLPLTADAALVRTDLYEGSSGAPPGAPHGSGAFTSTAFTPPNSSLIVVTVTGFASGLGSLSNFFTVTGGGLVWTRRPDFAYAAASFGDQRGEIWTAPVTTGTSMQISVDHPTATMDTFYIQAVAYTGHNTSSPIGGTAVDDTFTEDGFGSVTLSSTPQTTSVIYAARILTLDISNPGAATPGTGWTELYDAEIDDFDALQVQERTASTSPTVYWNDVNANASATLGAGALAIEIKAATRLTFSKPPNNLGLVGYWSFDEGAGTIATDFSGNGNAGTLSGDTVWVNGKRGKALDFDGTTDYVDVGNLSLSGTFTMSYWYYSEDNSLVSTVIGEDSGNVNGGPKIGQNGGNFFVRLNSDTSNAISMPSANSWHHVVIVRDASDKVDLYVDGGAANRIFLDTAQSGTYVVDKIAANGNDSSQSLTGKIDEVRVYNRALGPTEVAALYGGGSNPGAGGAVQIGASTQTLQNGTSLGSGLVGHWSFDGPDVTTTVTDRAGTNHGYFVGGATSSAKISGKLGQALNFDGTDDRINFPVINAGTVNSAALWIDYRDSGDGVLIGQEDGGTGEYFLYVDQTDVYYSVSTGVFVTVAHGGLPSGQWTHLAVTRNETTVTFYKNGAQIGTPQTLGVNDVMNVTGTIGSYGNGTFYTQAKMDDVRIYNRMLTAAEVKQLYQLGGTTLTP